LYVDTLVGADTVNTLAPKSIDALHAPGVTLRADTVTEGLDEAHQVLDDLEAAGVSYHDVAATIEREGVASFAASYDDLLAALTKRAAELT
jgi:transaldolase